MELNDDMKYEIEKTVMYIWKEAEILDKNKVFGIIRILIRNVEACND